MLCILFEELVKYINNEEVISLQQPDYYVKKVGQTTIMRYKSLDAMLGTNKYSKMLTQLSKFSVDKPKKITCYFFKGVSCVNISFYYTSIKITFNCSYKKDSDIDEIIVTNKLLGKPVFSNTCVHNADPDVMDMLSIIVNSYHYIVR